MKKINTSCCLLLLCLWLGSCTRNSLPAAGTPNPTAAYQFGSTPSWQDEFNGEGLPDTTRWSYDTGGHGWGNNELQYYTAGGNATLHKGYLTIEARREAKDSNAYTSARMVTKYKGDFLYGRFEVRARLPAGRGLWPAIWMLPTDWAYGGWPASGEIDIMEQVGYDPSNIHISVHTKDYNHVMHTQKTDSVVVPTATTAFHVYRVDWTPKYVMGFVDDLLAFQFFNEGKGFGAWPFDKRFHLLLNIAVGGFWGGAQGIDETVFPARMDVDYVRVYPLIK